MSIFNNNTRGRTGKGGFTFVELLIYIGFLSMFLTVMINCVVLFSKSWATIRAHRALNTSAVALLERITRDVRNATAINVGASSFATSTGALTITTKDDAGSFVATTYQLSTTTNSVTITQNGVTGPITPAETTVSNLTFWRFSTTQADGIRIGVTMTGNANGKTATQTFYTSVLSRGQYRN